jgi:hypothetical protein
VRPPVDHIPAPSFPRKLPWFGAAMLRMDQQRGRPVLVEFWDFCRANSMRTLPYLKAWHERYAELGLRVIGVHASEFAPAQDPAAVGAAAERLEIPYPVVVDLEWEIWQLYGNQGWPARYLWGPELTLFDFHLGEGGYQETELAIQMLLGAEREPVAPLRPEDAPDAELVPQSADVLGPYSGPFEAGGVWAVLSGAGAVRANGREIDVTAPGCYELIRNEVSVSGELELELSAGVDCHAVQFTPGLRSPVGPAG